MKTLILLLISFTISIKTIANDKPFKIIREYEFKTGEYADAFQCSHIPQSKAVCMTEDQFRYVRGLQEKNQYLRETPKTVEGWSVWEVVFASALSFLAGVAVNN